MAAHKKAMTSIEKVHHQIYGYTHEHDKNFPAAIIEIIYQYFDKIKNQYMYIYTDKEAARIRTLGSKVNHTKLAMPSSKRYWFNENYCPQCRQYGGADIDGMLLKFVASNQGNADGNNSYYATGFYNNANQYQCDLCKYYVIHNVKRRVFYASGYGHKKATPFVPKLKVYAEFDQMKANEIKAKYPKKSKRCDECKKDTVQLQSDFAAAPTGKVSRDELCYCIECCLFYDYYEYNS